MAAASLPKVVIIGGGLGGLEAAKAITRAPGASPPRLFSDRNQESLRYRGDVAVDYLTFRRGARLISEPDLPARK